MLDKHGEEAEMLKDIAISLLGTLLAMEWTPWTAELGIWERVSVGAGWTSALIIFCLFCDRCAGRWRRYRQRVERVRQSVDKLAGLKGGRANDSTGGL